jgi:hypothetical protein
MTRYLLLFDSYGRFYGAPSLTRGRVCLLYMMLALASAVFLRSESLGTCDHILLRQIWDFPLRRLLRLAGCQPSTNSSGYNISARTAQKRPLLCCSSIVSAGTCLFTKPLLSNGCLIFVYLVLVAQHPAMGQHATIFGFCWSNNNTAWKAARTVGKVTQRLNEMMV